MNELRLLLENIQRDVAILNCQFEYEVEKYDELVRPWRFRIKPEDAKPKTVDSKPNDSSEDEFSQEIQRVDSILKKARLVRGSRDVLPTAKHFNKNQICKECMKGICAKHKKTHLQSGRKSAKNTKDLASKDSLTSKKINSKEQFAKKFEDLSVDNGSSEAHQSKCDPQTSKSTCSSLPSEYEYVKLEDILITRSAPSKYRKLRNMHAKLKASNVFLSPALDKPVQSELKFVAKMLGNPFGQGEVKENENTVNDTQNVFTVTSSRRNLTLCHRKLCNLTHTLLYHPMISVKIDHRSSPSALYREKLICAQASSSLIELEKDFNRLRSSFVVNYFPSEIQPSLQNDDADFIHLPCQTLTYEKLSDPVRHCQALNDLRWLRMEIYLKEKVHTVLHEYLIARSSRTAKHRNSKQDIDEDFVACMSSFYGLLAKQNRCSINPAVVLDHSS